MSLIVYAHWLPMLSHHPIQVYLFGISPCSRGVTEKCLYLYKANISASFLDKFEQPSQHVEMSPLVVSYIRLSMRSPWFMAGQLEKFMFSELNHPE